MMPIANEGGTAQHGYDALYADWKMDSLAWWERAAEGIHWERRWDQVFDEAQGPYGRWFAGGRLNTCYNCVDRHVEQGRGAQTALIWDSPVTGDSTRISYRELKEHTAKLAGALAALGVRKGDRVLI